MATKTIVLRFRDINVNTDETIQEHLRVISDHSYCWWGWLYRHYERNPHAELAQLHKEIVEEVSTPYPILLYHTGQGRIYEAMCASVVSYPQPARSPEVMFTPNYYSDRKAPAWFKLTSIEEVAPTVVSGKKCVLMPSAAQDSYTDLLDKTVTRKEDLRRQEVTLWVLA